MKTKLKTIIKFLGMGAVCLSTGCTVIKDAIAEATGYDSEWLDLSSDGLNFNASNQSFSGLSETSLSSMPASGTANYIGNYSLFDRFFDYGDTGTAVLSADFASGSVELTDNDSNFSDLSGTISGAQILNNASANGPDRTLKGQFFGEGASMVGANFSDSPNSDGWSGGFIGKK